jgi:hypothetical protein
MAAVTKLKARERSARTSGFVRSTPGPDRDSLSMSMRLWGLDWSNLLPWHFEDARVEFATQDDVFPFIRDHYPSIFATEEASTRFLSSPMTEAKGRFFKEMDFFSLWAGQDMAGVFMAHPSDWSTYYLRSTAVLPQYRDRHLMSRFFEQLDVPLRDVGVERIEADCSPANVPIVRVMLSQGYVVTGSVASERWGFTSRYTKFISEGARSTFIRQYTAMPVSQFKPNKQ